MLKSNVDSLEGVHFMVKKWTKIIASIVIALMSMLLHTTPLYAASNDIYAIDVVVDLQQNGDAHITQTWQTYVDNATELYFELGNLQKQEIKNFRVYDESGTQYTPTDDWASLQGFDAKAYKSGVKEILNNTFELCWGVSGYGVKTYTLSYTITNMITSYEDYDGFSFRFINDAKPIAPDDASVTLKADGIDFTSSNTGIWAFGYEGTFIFANGLLKAENEQPLTSRQNMTLMARFDKGLFQPTITTDKAFLTLVEKAFVGSDYDIDTYSASGGDATYIPPKQQSNNISSNPNIHAGYFVFFAVAIASSFIKKLGRTKPFKYALTIKDMKKSGDYYREIPFNHHLPSTIWALRELQSALTDGEIMGAYILRLIANKHITLQEDDKMKFFSTKKGINIMFHTPPTDDEAARDLFDILQSAAGKDGILQEKEFKKWLRANHSRMTAWSSGLEATGESILTQTGFTETIEVRNFFKTQQTILNQRGLQEVKHTVDLQHFLEDFSLINERQPIEVHLWQDYLVFAALFGIADQVAKDLKQFYPQQAIQFEQSLGGSDFYTTIWLVNNFSHNYQSSLNSAISASSSRSSSGGGGGSSSGGGGGFSGGGSGGGFR